MHVRLFTVLALAGVPLALAGNAAFAQSSACSRECLAEMLEDYLDAVVAHDPAAAPLFVGFRQTENAVVVPRGEGMWRSATGLGSVQRRFFDPETGSAVYFGVVEEGGNAAIVMLRVRVESREITEAEWTIGRRGDPGIDGPVAPGEQGGNLYDLENLLENSPPERTVARAQRLPRAALVAIANSYFDGISNHDGDIIMAHPGCLRVENGLQTTGRPLPPERSDDGHEGRSDCTSNMGGFNIAFVAGRRYPLVDEEAQVVLGTVVFLRYPGTAQRRNGLSELFYVDGGRIREIHAAMFYPAPEQPTPNWPPYDGNFPLSAPPVERAGARAAADASSGAAVATAAWAAAYNSHDPTRVLAQYADDAVLWGTRSETLRATRAEIGAYFASLATRPNAHVTIGEHRVRELGDVAISTGYYTFTDVVNGERVERPSRFSFTFRNRGGEWLIVDHHSSRVPSTN